MLYPQNNRSRMVQYLDGLWDFYFEDDTKEIYSMYVPASYNDLRENSKFRNYYGKVYYERDAIVPKAMEKMKLFIRFSAVCHDAKVWINDNYAGGHRGGFLPFDIDVTDFVNDDGVLHIKVEVDNRINSRTLPVGSENGHAFMESDNEGIPSVEQAKITAAMVNRPNFDFFNYAGIHRHVMLYAIPVEYIEDITINTDIDGDAGVVDYSIGTNTQAADEEVVVKINDMQGNQVAEKNGKAGKLIINDAKLWEPYPGEPYLYKLEVHFKDDIYTEEFGIRTIKVSGNKFLINNKPFYFKGFGKHEDSFIHGKGIDECLNVKDIGLLQWLGANSFRTSHYPYSEEMMRLCDKEGIVVIDEVPAVGFTLNNYSEDGEGISKRNYHKKVIYEMINRDKNHPCVVMWSIANEPPLDMEPEMGQNYFKEIYDYTHSIDSSNRPVSLACCQNNYEIDLTTRTMDVVMINRYYGWYNLTGDMDAACNAWNIELDFWENIGKPVIISEYGADTIEGLHGVVGEMFTEEFQKEYYRRIDDVLDKRRFIVGEHCWAFSDFNTFQGIIRVDGNRKGVFNRNRRPKLAAFFLHDRWNNIPNFNYK